MKRCLVYIFLVLKISLTTRGCPYQGISVKILVEGWLTKKRKFEQKVTFWQDWGWGWIKSLSSLSITIPLSFIDSVAQAQSFSCCSSLVKQRSIGNVKTSQVGYQGLVVQQGFQSSLKKINKDDNTLKHVKYKWDKTCF